jgi:hypothetical protein
LLFVRRATEIAIARRCCAFAMRLGPVSAVHSSYLSAYCVRVKERYTRLVFRSMVRINSQARAVPATPYLELKRYAQIWGLDGDMLKLLSAATPEARISKRRSSQVPWPDPAKFLSTTPFASRFASMKERPLCHRSRPAANVRAREHPGANRIEARVQDPWTSWGLHTRQGL